MKLDRPDARKGTEKFFDLVYIRVSEFENPRL